VDLLKFPYLKKVGWNGFIDGKQSGVYRATPLSRLNVAEGWQPRSHRKSMRGWSRPGGRPVTHAGHSLGQADRDALCG